MTIKQSLARPFNTMFALIKMAWAETTNRSAYQGQERNLVVIPYHNPPLVELRSRLMSLSSITRWAIAAPLLLAIILLYSAVLGPTIGAKAANLVLVGMGIVCFSISLVLYLLFGIEDFIRSDSFSLFVPTVVLAKQWLATTAGKNVFISSSRVYWSDLLEVSIIDSPTQKGRHRFCLKLSCKSGANFEIPITNIPKASVDLLANELEKNAPFCRNLSQLAEITRFQDYEKGLLPGISYNQLWESLTAKRIEATSFTPLPPNCKLQNGRLTIVRQVASGGFSAVYLVEEPDGAKFILKESVLPFGVDQELARKASEHFAREARILRSLRHKQIARVYDHFVEQGRHYLLIEQIRGRTLRQIVFEEGPQSEEKVLSYSIQIAEILDYLHNQELPIIHRDLTPDNLIVNEYGKLFLIDFGSANEFTGTATGTLVGKHAYMSPEQVRGKATPASDIYSFGQTICYCLSACDPKPLMSSSLPQAETTLSKKLNRVIQKCTELEEAKRFTLSELRESLLDYTKQEGS